MRHANTAVVHRGFTLIELLVVITIIVVLLALLTPALDKAVYQAQLASCAANLKGIATGATVYAADFRQFYPDRQVVRDGWLTTDLRYSQADDRPVIRNHIPLNLMADPLVAEVDLNFPSTRVQSSFTSLWFGTQYPGHKGMRKLGDRFGWTDSSSGTPIEYSFNLLASDSDYFIEARLTYSSHPDEKETMTNYRKETPEEVMSYWVVGDDVVRGTVDFNYAFADGSVSRLDRVKTNKTQEETDDRVARVPLFYSGNGAVNWYQQVPKPR